MLSDLSAIAAALSLSFLHGDAGQINKRVDDVRLFPLLYVEGYAKGRIAIDQQVGKMRLSYDLDLWLIAESELADEPETRAVQLATLEMLMLRIIKAVQAIAELPAEIPFSQGIDINGLDRNADGIRFSFTATPFIQHRIC